MLMKIAIFEATIICRNSTHKWRSLMKKTILWKISHLMKLSSIIWKIFEFICLIIMRMVMLRKIIWDENSAIPGLNFQFEEKYMKLKNFTYFRFHLFFLFFFFVNIKERTNYLGIFWQKMMEEIMKELFFLLISITGFITIMKFLAWFMATITAVES